MFDSTWKGSPRDLEKEIKAEAKKRYGWISVNKYRALCLNSNKVFFGDIDCMIDSGSERLHQLVHSEEEALTFIEHVANRENLCFRVYKTYAGIRVIEISKTHDPKSEETRRILKRLGCDSAFIDLTRKLETFRARLTPKPWRADPYVVNFKSMESSISAYLKGDGSGPRWQVAKFIKVIGKEPEVLEPEIEFMVQLHDECCVANDDRPLA